MRFYGCGIYFQSWDIRPRMHPPSILTINLLSLLQRTLSIMDASSILTCAFYWLQDIGDSGQISVVHCPTAKMPADLLTKSLTHVKVGLCRDMLGLAL